MVMRESQEIKATYRDGVFLPSEPVELEDGCEVTVSVNSTAEQPPRSTELLSNLPRHVQWILEEQATWPDEERDHWPRDFAMNYKHYLYGHPKEGEE